MTSDTDRHPPSSPSKLPKRSWLKILKRSGQEYSDDNLSDAAAALTYYAIQAIFPGAIVLLSLVGLLGENATRQLIENLGQVVPGTAQDTILKTITGLQENQSAAGLALVVSLTLGIWSASGYVAAFMRAANVVYDVPEVGRSGRRSRPGWPSLSSCWS